MILVITILVLYLLERQKQQQQTLSPPSSKAPHSTLQQRSPFWEDQTSGDTFTLDQPSPVPASDGSGGGGSGGGGSGGTTYSSRIPGRPSPL